MVDGAPRNPNASLGERSTVISEAKRISEATRTSEATRISEATSVALPPASLLAAALALVLGLISPALAAAVDDPPVEDSPQSVFLESITPFTRDGKKIVRIKGTAPEAPSGTKVDFVLTFRAMTIQTFEFTVPDSRNIDVEFTLGRVPRSKEQFYFRTIIDSKKQSASVLKGIEKNPRTFRQTLDPWTDHHFDHRFRLYSLEEESALLAPIQEFFGQRLDRIDALRRALEVEAELASLGEKYTDQAGQFSSEKWREHLEAEFVQPLLALRTELSESLSEPRMIPFRRALNALRKMTLHAALRGFQKSVSLHRELGVAPPKKLIDAASLELTKGERRELLAFDVAEGQKVIREELRLVPTDYVEDAFQMVVSENFQGILFRHLTDQERAGGKFDPVRERASWTPDEEQIRLLEETLPAYLASVPEAETAARLLRNYRRQYIGLERDGRRVIHLSLVNSRSPRLVETVRRVLTASPRDQVVTLEYDPTGRSFSQFATGD